MSVVNFKSALSRSSVLTILLVTLFSASAFAGADFYEVYLNNKLIKKQYVGDKTSGLMDIQLDKRNENDKLVIRYFHCHVQGVAKGRNILIKNAQNQVIKEWKFADATGSDGAMTIPVKDILALQKSYPSTSLNLYYFTTAELPNGLMLAAVKPTGKSVSYSSNHHSIQYAKL